MSIFSKAAISLAALPVLAFATPAFADSPGQLTTGGSGSNAVYTVKDLTQSGSYNTSANPVCGDKLQYSLELHNTNYGGLTNVVVSANLTNGTATAVPTDAGETASQGTNGSVNVTLPSGDSLSYDTGSATLSTYDPTTDQVVLDKSNIGDITNGVNVGTVQGSTTEFVDFTATVTCPPAIVTPPATTTTTTPTPTSTPTVTTTSTPTTLANTGPGDVIAIFGAVSVAGVVAYRLMLGRRLARQ